MHCLFTFRAIRPAPGISPRSPSPSSQLSRQARSRSHHHAAAHRHCLTRSHIITGILRSQLRLIAARSGRHLMPAPGPADPQGRQPRHNPAQRLVKAGNHAIIPPRGSCRQTAPIAPEHTISCVYAYFCSLQAASYHHSKNNFM